VYRYTVKKIRGTYHLLITGSPSGILGPFMISPETSQSSDVVQQGRCESPLSDLSVPPVDGKAFRAALPRGSHVRDFAISCVTTYAASSGLAGLHPAFFSDAHDIHKNLAKNLIPAIIRDLVESGIVIKALTPFESYLGVFPSPPFLKAVINDHSILQLSDARDKARLDTITPVLMEVSMESIEQRWLKAISNALLCVKAGEGMSVSNFMKCLPEFDGRDKVCSSVFDALHEQERITVTSSPSGSEIFVSEAFFDCLDDVALVDKIKDHQRRPELFPWMKREALELERIQSVYQEPVKPPRVAPSIDRPRVRAALARSTPPTSDSTAASLENNDFLGGNQAGREVRARILRAFEKVTTLAMGELTKQLADLDLTDSNVRYHVSFLCDGGFLLRKGKGRGATISRA